MNDEKLVQAALDHGAGVLRLAPTWVPRSFCIPGRRIKLHPDDYYAFGADRGGIDERWFSSTTPADNGPGTTPDEGLSYIVWQDGGVTHRVLVARRHRLGWKADHRRQIDGRLWSLANV